MMKKIMQMFTRRPAKSYVVVSFYTLNSGYEVEIQEKLIPSLKRLNVPYDVVGLNSQGSWNLNIYQKAYVIRDMLIKHESMDIVWLDSDAVLCRNPDEFESMDEDFGCHFRFGRKLSSGTMFFRNNGRIVSLVNDWVEAIEGHPEYGVVTEQAILKDVLERRVDVSVCRLPLEYSMIFDAVQVEDPVVTHYQASRRFKAQMSSSS